MGEWSEHFPSNDWRTASGGGYSNAPILNDTSTAHPSTRTPARQSAPSARPYPEPSASKQHHRRPPKNQTYQHTSAMGTTYSAKVGQPMKASHPPFQTPPLSKSVSEALQATRLHPPTGPRPRTIADHINPGHKLHSWEKQKTSSPPVYDARSDLLADTRREQRRGTCDAMSSTRSTLTGSLLTGASDLSRFPTTTQTQDVSPLDNVSYRAQTANHPPSRPEERIPAAVKSPQPPPEHCRHPDRSTHRKERERLERSPSGRLTSRKRRHRIDEDERRFAGESSVDVGVRSSSDCSLLMQQELVAPATRSSRLSRRMVYDAYTWFVCSIEILEMLECQSSAHDRPTLSQPSTELLERMVDNHQGTDITLDEMKQRCNSFLLILAIQLSDCNASIRADVNRQLLDVAEIWQRTAKLQVDSASAHFVKQLMVVLYGGQPKEMKTDASERLGASWMPDGKTMGSVMHCCQVGLHAGAGLEAEYRQDPGKETLLPEFRHHGAFM